MTFFENALNEKDLCLLGENLAAAERVTKLRGKVRDNSREIKSILQIIENTCSRINEERALKKDRRPLPGEEWICDNQVFVEIKAEELKHNLEARGKIKLPLVERDGKTLPRIAVLARELANHTDGAVTFGALTSFLQGYCKISGLSTDELYMLKFYLQLAVLRRIATACMIMDFRSGERRQALKVYNMLKQYLDSRSTDRALEMWLSDMSEITPAFCTALLRQAAEEGADTEAYRKILEKKLQGRYTSLDNLGEQEYRLRLALGSGLGNSITALGAIPAFNWKDIVERESAVINILSGDPSGVFPKMNSRSKMAYVRAVEKQAARRKISPEAVAAEAVEQARAAGGDAHVGTYIKNRVTDKSLIFISACAVLTVALAFAPAVALFMTGAGVLLIPPLLILCRNIAVQVVQRFFDIPPLAGDRPQVPLPGLDYSKGIPKESSVMVVIPALLLNGAHVNKIFDDLEAIYCGNRGENVYCALTGDLRDSDTKVQDMDSEILRTGKERVRQLNEKYGKKFFFYCRERTWQPGQNKWIGWERKRGGIIEFNRKVAGKVAFVLTVDEGTLVPPGAVAKMAEIMAHPLNKHYGILQPDIGTVPAEGPVSRYSRIFSPAWGRESYGGSGGFYFNLCHQGSYTGKGMYNPVRFNKICEDLFPDERILSHDLIEGCFLGCASTGDVSLYESFPADMSQDIKRQHRWTRGDWQLLPYLRGHFTDRNGRRRKNPLTPISKFKIRDNMIRSLVPGSLCFYAIGSLFLPETLGYAVPVIFMAAFVKVLIYPEVKSLKQCLAQLALAPYMAYVMTDAAVRAMWRLFVSQKNLLEWVTSAQTALNGNGKKRKEKEVGESCPAPYRLKYLREARRIWAFYEDYVTKNDNFLPPDNVQFEPVYAVAHRTSPTNIGYYLLACLEAYRLGFISKTQLVSRVEDTLDTLDKMSTFKGHFYNWYDTISLTVLTPEFVSSVDSGNLCACLITLSRGLKNIDPGENFMSSTAAQVTKELVSENAELWQPKHRRAISEAAAEETNVKNPQWRQEFDARVKGKLWTGDRPPVQRERQKIDGCQENCGQKLWTGDRPLVQRIDELVEKMDFTFLMDPGRMILYTGFDVQKNSPTTSFYDTAASEARLTSYIAIAKGDLPAEHFDRPLRKFGNNGKGILQAWSGTGFEFYMPELFFKGWQGTLWDMTIEHVTHAQMEYGKQKGIPWGISESGYNSRDINLNYKYKAFGVPGLGMKQEMSYPPVISPYTGLMIADRYPRKVMKNLNALAKEGALGTYGFREAVDFTRSRAGVVESSMAHHLGMSLSGLTNLLADDYVRKTFNNDPAMAECRILLAERPPRGYKKAVSERTVTGVKSQFPDKESERIQEPITASCIPLSNGRYTCFADVDGWNRSFFNDIEMTKEGVTVYIHDKEENLLFSTGKYPVPKRPDEYRTNILPHCCISERRDGQLITEQVTCVSPEDNTEIRRVRLTNCGDERRKLEITAVCRPALNLRRNWQDHQTYSDLFITTEYPTDDVITAESSRTGASMFMAMTTFAGTGDRPQVAFSRQDIDMTGVRPLVVEPGETRDVFIAVGVGKNYEKYTSPESCRRSLELAAAMTAVEKETLGIDSNRLHSFINLADHIIKNSSGNRYGDAFYRHADAGAELRKWGISGEKPIVAVFVNRMEEVGFIRRMVKFRDFCNFRKLPIDLVVAAPSAMEAMVRAETGTFFSGEKDCLAACAALVLKPGIDGELPGKEIAYKDTYYRPVPRWQLGEKPEFKAALIGSLEFFNGFGGFDKKGREYVILGGRPTPAPWINCISNKEFGFTVSGTGGGTVWNINSKENRITPWNCDVTQDKPEEVIYISRVGEEEYLTPTPHGNTENYVIRHAPGKTVFLCKSRELETELTVFAPMDSSVKYSVLTISNLTAEPMDLDLVYRVNFAPPRPPYRIICTHGENALLFNCFRKDPFGALTSFMGCSSGIRSFSCDSRECYPGAKNFSSKEGISQGPCGAIQTSVRVGTGGLSPVHGEGGRITVIFALGQTFSDESRQEILDKCVFPEKIFKELNSVENYWTGILDCVMVDTPDKALNYMVNSRLLYQVIACRIWGRTAFYQSGGAFGFRDQLQDSLALLFCRPDMVKDQILLHCSRQFKEGDVQHWWHPPTGSGVRTRCSDDLLWLPYAVYEYVNFTGDKDILSIEIPYLESPELEDGQQDRYETPTVSDTTDTVFRHCVKAVEKAMKYGEHGLPLIGSCDWNDGMSNVGTQGKGESVWLAWFLCTVLDRMAELCEITGVKGDRYRAEAGKISESVEKNAWAENHYLRAFFDSGRPMKIIDAISQAWAVISGRCLPERGEKALATAEEALVDREHGLIRLLTPPFNKENSADDDPGYIAFYPEGIRENGAQYTHGVLWFIKALFLNGQHDKAYELLSMINPINHSLTSADAIRYRTEPYAVAADIYSEGRLAGRGGWSWYTGSAAWMYKVITEDLLGITCKNGKISIFPRLPSCWNSYRLKGVICGEKIDTVVKRKFL